MVHIREDVSNKEIKEKKRINKTRVKRFIDIARIRLSVRYNVHLRGFGFGVRDLLHLDQESLSSPKRSFPVHRTIQSMDQASVALPPAITTQSYNAL